MDFLIIALVILVALLFVALILQIFFPDEKSDKRISKKLKKIIKKASWYVENTSSSRMEIIAILRKMEYPMEDCLAAIDSLNVNWNNQAKKAADNYLKIAKFNKDELVSQLQFDGFTLEEAQFGANSKLD
ncbi:MAG: Ltp family lipoprotein [Clostridia bacterium]|nr:Ltp family lipoprotein [Clostridia bacterium]MBR2159953.1 Ltp family lipoprotein [Clostridia bacterium]